MGHRNAIQHIQHIEDRLYCWDISCTRQFFDHMNQNQSYQCCCYSYMVDIYHLELLGHHSNQEHNVHNIVQCILLNIHNNRLVVNWNQTYSCQRKHYLLLVLDMDIADTRIYYYPHQPCGSLFDTFHNCYLQYCLDSLNRHQFLDHMYRHESYIDMEHKWTDQVHCFSLYRNHFHMIHMNSLYSLVDTYNAQCLMLSV